MRPLLALIALAFITVLAGCTPATPEPIDTAHLAGRWELTTAGETEWLDIDASGTFTGSIQGNGFLAQTLSQGPSATLQGNWTLAEHSITFTISDSSDEALSGQVKTYEIESLTDRTMHTADADGTHHELVKAL